MSHARAVRVTLVGALLAIAACQALPVASKSTASTRKATATASRPSVSPKASATPKPTPSLGLLLTGKVSIDPSKLLELHLAELTSGGVRIVSNNGGGLISDNGLGLISDNGLGVIANNGGSYRLAGAAGTSKAVEGMHVSAVSLYDGKVLAGPVATKADGSYDLGFVTVGARNMRVVATVPGRTDAAFTYASLAKPTAKTALNSDTTRAFATMVLGVLPGYVQPIVEGVKAGVAIETLPQANVALSDEFAPVLTLLQRIGPDRLKAFDQDGAFARELSDRTVSFVDLDSTVFTDLRAIADDLAAYDAAHPQATGDPLVQASAERISQGVGPGDLKAFMIARGMDEATAQVFDDRISEKATLLGQLLFLTTLGHQDDVLGPFERLVK